MSTHRSLTFIFQSVALGWALHWQSSWQSAGRTCLYHLQLNLGVLTLQSDLDKSQSSDRPTDLIELHFGRKLVPHRLASRICRSVNIYMLNLFVEVAHFSLCIFIFFVCLSLLVKLTMCTIEFAVSIFRCVVFNNRGIAGEELLVRMTSKINISHL